MLGTFLSQILTNKLALGFTHFPIDVFLGSLGSLALRRTDHKPFGNKESCDIHYIFQEKKLQKTKRSFLGGHFLCINRRILITGGGFYRKTKYPGKYRSFAMETAKAGQKCWRIIFIIVAQ